MRNSDIDISIIIPVYNVEKYIIKCLQSVTAQTFVGSYECIIVDDCGVDNSIDLVKMFVSSYEGPVHFIILHQEQNMGPSAARNRGIREAKGNYVFFLDADDVISTDCLFSLFSLAKQYDLDYVQGMYHSDEHYHMPVYAKEECNIVITNKNNIKENLLNYMYIPFTPHNRLVCRRFLIQHNLYFPEKIKVREDFYWMFFIAKYVERMAICDKVTYFRGYNGDSLTHNINKDREIHAYRILIEDFCANIDPFMNGEQKVLILDTLLMCIKSKYYVDDAQKNVLINMFKRHNSLFQCFILNIIFAIGDNFLKAKLVHLLNRLYRGGN